MQDTVRPKCAPDVGIVAANAEDAWLRRLHRRLDLFLSQPASFFTTLPMFCLLYFCLDC